MATILEVCPRVKGLFGLKYGQVSVSHGSPSPPQVYPLITSGRFISNRSTNSQNVCVGGTSAKA
ncbi:MAG TPA: hypothetical protein VFR15_18225 [Chloroflexia bacterium]|nr:hypothetical protein [Chloroflexia bacterium]